MALPCDFSTSSALLFAQTYNLSSFPTLPFKYYVQDTTPDPSQSHGCIPNGPFLPTSPTQNQCAKLSHYVFVLVLCLGLFLFH